jgi:hypothetical protein
VPVIATGGQADPIATLIPDPNVDYGELAAAHHALAEAAALDMQRLAAELLALREREAKGNHYVSRLLTGDEDVAAANMLLRAIGDDIQAVSLELDQAARTCWNACRNAYVATAMLHKAERMPATLKISGQGATEDPSQVSGVIEDHSNALYRPTARTST